MTAQLNCRSEKPDCEGWWWLVQEGVKISSMEAIGIVLSLLNQTVEELKRIDAEQKSLDKVVTDLSNIHP